MDIGALLRHEVDVLPIEGTYSLDSTYYQNTDIMELKPIKVTGSLQLVDNSPYIKATIIGEMIIPDSVSLEPVTYPFACEIDENVEEKIKNSENTLAIMDILWENIVLEIPIRYSRVNDYSNFSGDGWKLIDEQDYQNTSGTNPFKELLEEFGEE